MECGEGFKLDHWKVCNSHEKSATVRAVERQKVTTSYCLWIIKGTHHETSIWKLIEIFRHQPTTELTLVF